jgi:N6-L-threonylcarbamoyladenine synthase
MYILGIETSCDETSVALLRSDGEVRCNLIASQIARHRPFGGVVPEIASREHLVHLFPLLEEALREAGASWAEVETIAVTAGPGLIGALLVGVSAAQGLSYALGIPLVAVNHLEGHLFSPFLRPAGPSLPLPDRFLSIVISGGHSSIYDVAAAPNGRLTIGMLNRTRDDAIGETFDKVAKFVGLPYPGGPQIERLARAGKADRKRFPFPLPQFKESSVDFSFSGLKAGAIRWAREFKVSEDPATLADFCATFQDALFDQLFSRLDTIWDEARRSAPPGPTEIGLAGGVAANGVLRERMEAWGRQHGVIVRLAEKKYCTDNAAMIAFVALQRRYDARDPRLVTAHSRLTVGTSKSGRETFGPPARPSL